MYRSCGIRPFQKPSVTQRCCCGFLALAPSPFSITHIPSAAYSQRDDFRDYSPQFFSEISQRFCMTDLICFFLLILHICCFAGNLRLSSAGCICCTFSTKGPKPSASETQDQLFLQQPGLMRKGVTQSVLPELMDTWVSRKEMMRAWPRRQRGSQSPSWPGPSTL